MAGTLSIKEVHRYGRHLLMPEVGVSGQERLKQARVLIVGMGGLGSPVAMYLAAAGIGVIGIVDNDVVEESNLHRQPLYETADIGCSKLSAARERLWALNPLVEIVCHETRLTSANAVSIMEQYDVVVDASDNFPTRYLVNDCCVILNKPNVFGAIHRFEGQASVFAAPDGPCYRCFFSEPPPPQRVRTCADEGVLGIMPGIIGCIQATETIKLLLQGGTSLSGRLLLVDAWSMRFREVALGRDPACPVCGAAPSIRAPIDYRRFCGMPPDQPVASGHTPLTAAQLRRLLDQTVPLQIVEVREPTELELDGFPDRRQMSLGDIVVYRNEFDPGTPLVLVCKLGMRSETAARLLQEYGYPGRIYTLQDGILGWMRQTAPYRGVAQ